MKKIFIVSGEVSGDKIGAWYLKHLIRQDCNLDVHAVGGNFLQNSGAKLYERINNLNIVGVFEVVKKLPFVFKFLQKLSTYIDQNKFDNVVLVDFPGFNLRLARKLKKLNPKIFITYVSPPQTWVWGAWRIKDLKKYCDKLVVLYPFEIEWYKKYGLKTEFLGNPLCIEFKKNIVGYDQLADKNCSSCVKDVFESPDSYEELLKARVLANQIAIIPGSREVEVKNLFPIFAEIIRLFKRKHPEVKIILPLAPSIPQKVIERKIYEFNLSVFRNDINICFDEQEKFAELKKCCLAVTKPGTSTLELALLQVPSVVFYKTSWITYLLARPFVKVQFMSLPNLLLPNPVFKEFIQGDCKAEHIFLCLEGLYQMFLSQKKGYLLQLNNLLKVKNLLCEHRKS